MSLNYDRAFSLSINGQVVTAMSGNPDDALRVRFKVITNTVDSPNILQVIVTNLSADHASSIVEAIGPVTSQTAFSTGTKVVLTAGYVDNSGIIFSGDASFVINGRESPVDTTLQIFARDTGLAYDYGTISKSLAAGSTPKDHFDTFVQALAPFGVTAGYTPDTLSSPQYPRGVAFAGMVRDYMNILASSTQTTWSLQQGQLQMVPTNGYVPGAPFILNSQTGLIGMPTQTPGGIMARCLINPAINLGSGNLVSIDQSLIQSFAFSQSYGAAQANSLVPGIAADGIYRVLHIEVTGDSRGNDWYQDLTMIAVNGYQGNALTKYPLGGGQLTNYN